jgi:succinate-semialdehyde dehydrogenase/glutarate-semialdehyde dehydrogenase
MLREVDRLAILITLEMGKPLAESRDEVAFAAEYFDWCADAAVRSGGSIQWAPDGSSRIAVMRRPVGPCLLVTPWNFPLAIPARGVAAALAAGCTAVLRPSCLTPLSAMALCSILCEQGMADGVLNVVVSTTNDVTDVLLDDPRLRRLTFTGSSTVGRHLAARSAGQLLRTGMELGGQAPFIVFPDADLDAAVDGAVTAKMRNGGQACTAANHFYVHDELVDEFTRRVVTRLQALVRGRGTDPRVTLGPMVGKPQCRRLDELVDDAVARGAGVELAGGALPGPGSFFLPVVLRDPPERASLCREEIFGPVAPISAFSRESDVVAAANRSAQGLGGYVFTRDLDRALRVSEALEVGMVAINRGRISSVAAPFGGAKHSGYGTAGGDDPLGDYLVTQALTIHSPTPGEGLA